METSSLFSHKWLNAGTTAIKSMLKLLVLPVALGFALAPGSASASQFVTNGDFSNSTNANSFFFGFDPSARYLAQGWTGSGDWVAWCSTSGTPCDSPSFGGAQLHSLPAPAGTAGTNNFVGLDGTPGFDGHVYQTINGLIVGNTYTLSFAMATAREENSFDPGTETVTVTLGNESYTTPTIDTPANGNTPWVVYSTVFTYTGGGNVLDFFNLGTGVPPYALIDDVSLTGGTAAVPEPSTWVMIIAGFAGLGFFARVRRNRLAEAAVA